MAKYEVSIDGTTHEVEIVRDDGRRALLKVDGREYEIEAQNVSAPSSVSAPAPVSVPSTPSAPRPAAKSGGGSGGLQVAAPMPGLVLEVCVSVGDSVSSGDVLVRLEAMKMENDIQADVAGVVKEILVSQGDEVQEGQQLVQLEA